MARRKGTPFLVVGVLLLIWTLHAATDRQIDRDIQWLSGMAAPEIGGLTSSEYRDMVAELRRERRSRITWGSCLGVCSILAGMLIRVRSRPR